MKSDGTLPAATCIGEGPDKPRSVVPTFCVLHWYRACAFCPNREFVAVFEVPSGR